MVRQVEKENVEVKTIEIRDVATFIPALAIKLDPVTEGDRYLLARAGYGLTEADQGEYILLLNLNGGEGKYNCDPHGWTGATTMPIIHGWLLDSWEDVKSGDVVDVEYITGQTKECKVSERLDAQLGEYPIG